MLDIEKSFFIQHWEISLVVISIVYFVVRLRDKQKESASVTQQVNDEKTIENDEKSEEIDSDDLTPSLENVEYIPFKGATIQLKGGSQEFYNMANDRRSIRKFSRKHVDIEIVKKCIEAAGTAPSGAHTEPWTFCLVKRLIN